MARIDYWQYLLDRQGRPLEYDEVRVYLAGTLIEADIYLDATFGSTTTSSVANLTTNKYGLVQFWIGDKWEVEGGYEEDQLFKVRWYNSIDSIYEQIDNLYIYSPFRNISTSDSIAGNPTSRDRNRAISNTQGYDWDTHTDSTLPDDTPHDIAPATLFDLNEDKNKVISNKLGYQMYQLSDTASSTPIDVSAAGYYSETISSWNSAGGGLYYKDITHGFDNFYPAVNLIKDSSDAQVIPEDIRSISSNAIRIWVSENITMRIVVLG